ncbi:hypothetical protein ABR738_14220 [Streptomyces sp. Edi4]|uniref:hypothetical protein n=1 Tax=Streptomyces sp. Edi4 TaxID=3162527 RepID=UPI003305BB8E
MADSTRALLLPDAFSIDPKIRAAFDDVVTTALTHYDSARSYGNDERESMRRALIEAGPAFAAYALHTVMTMDGPLGDQLDFTEQQRVLVTALATSLDEAITQAIAPVCEIQPEAGVS